MNIKTLLFENVGIKQTIFKNTLWLAVAEVISRLLGAVLIIYVARILGTTGFGKFSFALSFVSMFVILSDFGLSDITGREFSKNKENEKEYSSVLSLKILLSAGALILMLIGSFFITPDPAIQKIVWILSIFVLISNFFFIIYAFLRARQRMEYEAGAKILQALIMAGVGFFILFKIPSVENISYGYLIANLATLILVLLFFHFRICPLNLGLDKNIWRKFFRSSWPLGLVAILGAVFMNIDSVIMGYWGQIAEVGWYNAARRIIGFITIPGTLIMMSFGPVMSKFFTESREKLQRVWNFYTESTIILAIPIVFGGLILAPKIIDFIYDQNFSLSIFVFQILIFATGINFLYNPYLVMLFISDQQKKYLWINLTAAIINIILNLILIPRYSLYGAAIATVITYLVILLLGIESLRKFTSVSIFNPRLPKILIMTIVSSLVMLAAIIQPFIYSLNVIIAIIIGMLIYFIILFLFYKSLYGLNFLLKNLAEK